MQFPSPMITHVGRCVLLRDSLFGGTSSKRIDADLSRLYTSTSIMQIDDNIMRCVCVCVSVCVSTLIIPNPTGLSVTPPPYPPQYGDMVS